MELDIFSKKCLGIDIGASSIKIVEVSSFGKRKRLENYIEFKLPPNASSLKTFQGETLLLLSDKVAEILRAIFKTERIRHREAAFSIPDFSTFFTTFTLPPMTEAEVPQAVGFEAQHRVPIPLSEVSFDWQIIEKEKMALGSKLKILLVAVPNRVLEQYKRMADLSGLEIKGIEAEVFGLMRSSVPENYSGTPVCLVDIGWQSTTVSIVEKRALKVSHSFDISGKSLTENLSASLKIGFEEAEEIKKRYGLNPLREDVLKVLSSSLNFLALEIDRVCQDFYQKEGRRVESLILAGGTTSIFGLKEYLESRIKKKIQIADPFLSISSPLILQSRLRELGPSLAVAVGVALMGVES